MKSIKNALLLGLVKILRSSTGRPHPLQASGGPHLLVVTTTALGDTLWALPALTALQKNTPQARISILTSLQGEQVIAASSLAMQCFTLQKPHLFSLARLFWKLRKEHFEAIYIFHTSQRIILPFCAMLSSAKIIGSKDNHKGLSSLLTYRIDTRQEHEIERRLRIVDLEVKDPSHKVLKITPTPTHREKAATILETLHLTKDRPIIAIHPGSKDIFKRWPKGHFITLGQKLKKQTPCQILITCGNAEHALAQDIAQTIEGAAVLPKNIDIATLSAVIEQCSVMITGDTGPMHIAAAVATPLIALFAATDSRLCGPRGFGPISVLQKGVTCTPCLKKKCQEPICMWQIGVDEVLIKALDYLQLPRKNTL